MNKMNKITIAMLLPLALFACSGSDSKVVATYKDGKVTEADIMKHFKKVFDEQPNLKDKKFADLDKNVQEQLVRSYILNQLLEKEAKDKNIENSDSFKEKIAAVKEQLVRQELIAAYAKDAATDAKIDAEYTQWVNAVKGKYEMQASHILVATQSEANDIKLKLQAGADFAELAKQYSKDDGSKSNGGSLGRFVQGKFVPEFEAKLSTMKKGDISDPVQTQFGWHVIRLEDKRSVVIPSKEDAKAEIINKINNDTVTTMVNDLTTKADIKLMLDDKAAEKKADDAKPAEATSSDDSAKK